MPGKEEESGSLSIGEGEQGAVKVGVLEAPFRPRWGKATDSDGANLEYFELRIGKGKGCYWRKHGICDQFLAICVKLVQWATRRCSAQGGRGPSVVVSYLSEIQIPCATTVSRTQMNNHCFTIKVCSGPQFYPLAVSVTHLTHPSWVAS